MQGHPEGSMTHHSNRVRVAAVQLEARTLDDPEPFYDRLDYYARTAASYGVDYLLFPEHMTLMLLSDRHRDPAEAMRRAAELTADFKRRVGAMATGHGLTIIAGSHAASNGAVVRNTAYVFLPDGAIHAREKIHVTPDEAAVWGMTGGGAPDVIDTPHGPIGVLICYDSEFPEAVRRLADQGARLLFVPYLTDTRHGHLRVRYCCQARAVECQIYVAAAGLCGALDRVENVEINYAQSAVLTPCDHPFARDGIAAEAEANIEQMIFADLDLGLIDWAREKGAVRCLADRRDDLYRIHWSPR